LSSYYGFDIPEIPPHVCAAMLASMKLVRAVRNTKFQLDDYYDMENYMHFTRRMDPMNPMADPLESGQIAVIPEYYSNRKENER
jgi:hypothetical protein